MMKYEVYTDGSCYWKTQSGGVGVYIKNNEKEIFFSQGYSYTTISRMELRAIIHALQLIEQKIGSEVVIYCDSEYTVNSINYKWIFQWEKDYWIGRKNCDLWMKFLVEYRKFYGGKLQFKWCRGHNGFYGNEVADILADHRQQWIVEEDLKDTL